MQRSLVCLLAVAVLGCTLITLRSGLQCQTTADCRQRGGTFATSVCTQAGICEPVTIPEGGASTTCASSAECVFTLGREGRCINGQCVPLIPDGVPCEARGNTTDDRGVLIGVLRPAASGSQGDTVTTTLPTQIDLLLGGWNLAVGTQGPQAGAIICDEGQLASALNTFNQVGVKFILGPLSETALLSVQSQVQIPVLSPMGDSPRFVETPFASGQPWFCNTNLAPAVLPFMSLVETIISNAGTARSLSNVNLAFVYNSAEPDEAEFQKRVKAGLVYNGLTPDQQPSFYNELDVNMDLAQAVSPQLTTASFQAAKVRPDVIALTSGAWSSLFIQGVEQRWGPLNGSAPRPVYVIMHFAPNDIFSLKSYGYDGRAYALDAARSGAIAQNYSALESLLQSVGNSVGVAEPYAASAYSDCLFAGLYGVSAAAAANGIDGAFVTPAEIAQGLRTASSGTTQGNLTVADVTKLLSLLDAKVPTQMVGGTTVIGFDVSTHAPSSNLGAYCIGSSTGPQAGLWTHAGITYDLSGAPSGSLACP